MSERDPLADLTTESGSRLGFMLKVQADLVREYSNDPNNPNVSAWLRSGAIEQIRRVEEEAGADKQLLVHTLGEILQAKRRVSHCSTPGTCLYPQHHSDDESPSAFVARLQNMAEQALLESGEA